jgi:hypothetical protein
VYLPRGDSSRRGVHRWTRDDRATGSASGIRSCRYRQGDLRQAHREVRAGSGQPPAELQAEGRLRVREQRAPWVRRPRRRGTRELRAPPIQPERQPGRVSSATATSSCGTEPPGGRPRRCPTRWWNPESAYRQSTVPGEFGADGVFDDRAKDTSLQLSVVTSSLWTEARQLGDWISSKLTGTMRRQPQSSQ